MLDTTATYQIVRTYRIKARDQRHAVNKLNKLISNGYELRYLTWERVTIEQPPKHPWLAEVWRQIKLLIRLR